MKNFKFLATGLCAVSLAAFITPTANAASFSTKANFVKQTGIASISPQNGSGVTVYSEPGKNPTGKVLPMNTNWKIFGYSTVNGVKWFNLGGNQWISSSETNYSASNNGPLYYGTTSAKGVIKINYKPGYGIAVWSQPGKDIIPGKYLKTGTSWKYFKTANLNGMLWYNLGGNQWVSAKYTTSNNPYATSKYVITKRFVTTITNSKGAKIYSDPNSGTSTGRILPKGSRWKAFKVLNNGILWYNLGGNQWISETDTF